MDKPFTKIHDSPYGNSPNNFHIIKHGDELSVELTYPPRSDEDNTNDQVRYVLVDQESVRASDGVRLFYDYERDGWVIQQASRFSWSADDNLCDPDWQEVAFVESWARQETDEEESLRVDGPAPAQITEGRAIANTIPKELIDKHKEGVEKLMFYGVPVAELDRDGVLAFANLCAQELTEMRRRFYGFAETMREMNQARIGER